MQPFIPILVFIVIAVIRAITSGRGSGPGRPVRPAAPPSESDAERRRRFMQALGLPEESPPPPPVQPRTAVNPRPLLPVNPPSPGGRLYRVPPALPTTGRRTQAPAVTTVQKPAPAPAPVAVLQPAPPRPSRPLATIPSAPATTPAARGLALQQQDHPAAALLLKLRDPGAIREAIILREILGPPKALQDRVVAAREW